jgi:RNA polymerase sigma-70 factor (ECF subfamily)
VNQPARTSALSDETDIRQLLASGRTREAFELIMARNQDKVFHLAWSMTRHEATARDLAQDAFLRLWRALPAYDGRAAVSTWLYAITRNVCLTELKRAASRRAVSLDAPESATTLETLAAPDPGGSPAGAALDVEALLRQMPEKYQQVLRLYYLEQKSYEETATLLGHPLGTVKTNLFRARKELAALAARQQGAPRQPSLQPATTP